jgi:copper chaperone NosL
MKKASQSRLSRIYLLVSSIGLFLILFLPLWRIELDAPQYPEGLALTINPSGLAGDVEIINGLNHYIGMKTLHSEDFIEFTILPYCIGFFGVLFMLGGLQKSKVFLNAIVISFLVFCVISMIDFWRWEYNYGHELNPDAAIQVPGMAYQPPLIGFKQLLNFGAYSIPASGGWIFASIALLGFFIFLKENIKIARLSRSRIGILLIGSTFMLSSCSRGPEPIMSGKDQCAFCKMTITDVRFAGELITEKGRIYKFDDVVCLHDYIEANNSAIGDSIQLYVTDFENPDILLHYKSAHYFSSEYLNSPMRGNVAAFSSEEACSEMMSNMEGRCMSHEEMSK